MVSPLSYKVIVLFLLFSNFLLFVHESSHNTVIQQSTSDWFTFILYFKGFVFFFCFFFPWIKDELLETWIGKFQRLSNILDLI